MCLDCGLVRIDVVKCELLSIDMVLMLFDVVLMWFNVNYYRLIWF